MTKITNVTAPAGADPKYQFFKDDSGQLWKATIEQQVAREAFVGDPELGTAPAELALTIIVSPTDAQGKALKEGDQPIILDSLTHTFTMVEMLQPTFDPANRISEMLLNKVVEGQARLVGHDKIKKLADDWVKPKKLNLKAETKPDVLVEPQAVSPKPAEGA